MIKVGVIGYGYWGPNLVRNFSEVDGAEVTWVTDLSHSKIASLGKRYPNIKTTTDALEVIRSNEVDAVVIATPVSTHYELASLALKEGKHVWVEKPMATSSTQIQSLLEESEKKKLTLMCDHSFIYTGAVRKIREMVQGGILGEILYYDSIRVNLGLFQHDVNVVWDLAVHDLSILSYTLQQRPIAVSTIGKSHVMGQPENLAYMTLLFDSPLIGHVNVNWLAPVKIRQTLIGGSKMMVVYDDLQPSEKIKVYDRGVSLADQPSSEGFRQIISGYRTGDIHSPQISLVEALRTAASHFLHSIQTGTSPHSDAKASLDVVCTLEAASTSIKNNGKLIEVKYL